MAIAEQHCKYEKEIGSMNAKIDYIIKQLDEKKGDTKYIFTTIIAIAALIWSIVK